jgi:CMP-N,N'-diacetyllegionaminic acid synthase
MRTLCVIPARGGSRGLPGKNIKMCGGKPLLVWTVEAARAAVLDVVVSSDDVDILDVAARAGAECWVRPSHLASDSASGLDVALDAARYGLEKGYSHILYLQPTSPCRIAEDIKRVLAMLADGVSSVVSVTEDHSCRVLLVGNYIVSGPCNALNRQDREPLWVLNGAIYAASIPTLCEWGSWYGRGTLAYKMPASRSIDIDDEHDLLVADLLLRHRLEQARVQKVGENVNE